MKGKMNVIYNLYQSVAANLKEIRQIRVWIQAYIIFVWQSHKQGYVP